MRNFTQPILICLAAALGLSLAGCAGTHLTQAEGVALVRTEGHTSEPPAGPIAARLLPYALLAERSYDGPLKRGAAPAPFVINCAEVDAKVCANKLAYEGRANELLAKYRAVKSIAGPLACTTPDKASCTVRVSGLGIHLWQKGLRRCTEAVIVFRGTDSNSLGDWLSNFHWITRILPIHDQYEQVHEHLKTILDKLKECRAAGAPVVAVGHSLGGGLAQHAAYVDPRIRNVFAFNPSMVTGYHALPRAQREANARGLRIERAYEHGEILAYPRYIARQFVPVTGCNPRIVNLRFNRIHGNILFQHKMHETNIGLLAAAHGSKPETRPLANLPCGDERPAGPRRQRAPLVAGAPVQAAALQ